MKLKNGSHVTTWEEFRTFVICICLGWLLIAGLIFTVGLINPDKPYISSTYCNHDAIDSLPILPTATDTPTTLIKKQAELNRQTYEANLKFQINCLRTAIYNFNEK